MVLIQIGKTKRNTERTQSIKFTPETDSKYFHYWLVSKLIVKREDGYYVLSEKTEKNLGGPYKTREEAEKRLRQVEYFKHKKE